MRRAGAPSAEPAADARPAAPQGAALIQYGSIRQRSGLTDRKCTRLQLAIRVSLAAQGRPRVLVALVEFVGEVLVGVAVAEQLVQVGGVR